MKSLKYKGRELIKNIDNISSINEYSKILHFVRHAEGHHNVAGEVNYEDYQREEFEDASLTILGINQCLDLYNQVIKSIDISNSQLLVVSPMRRTIQTATYSLPQFFNKIPWLGVENLREQSGTHPCDRRRPISEHILSYPHVDFSLISEINDPLYYKTEGRESYESVLNRANDFLQFISQRPEKEIIVVTHSSYLLHMLNDVIDIPNEKYKQKFFNCELRSVIVDFDS